jgi:hypothetical protein
VYLHNCKLSTSPAYLQPRRLAIFNLALTTLEVQLCHFDCFLNDRVEERLRNLYWDNDWKEYYPTRDFCWNSLSHLGSLSFLRRLRLSRVLEGPQPIPPALRSLNSLHLSSGRRVSLELGSLVQLQNLRRLVELEGLEGGEPEGLELLRAAGQLPWVQLTAGQPSDSDSSEED